MVKDSPASRKCTKHISYPYTSIIGRTIAEFTLFVVVVFVVLFVDPAFFQANVLYSQLNMHAFLREKKMKTEFIHKMLNAVFLCYVQDRRYCSSVMRIIL